MAKERGSAVGCGTVHASDDIGDEALVGERATGERTIGAGCYEKAWPIVEDGIGEATRRTDRNRRPDDYHVAVASLLSCRLESVLDIRQNRMVLRVDGSWNRKYEGTSPGGGRQRRGEADPPFIDCLRQNRRDVSIARVNRGIR
jgi:hypothetical protein